MSGKTISPMLDWEGIRLVAFDVDGTLYDQRALRICMLREMLVAALHTRSLGFIRILREYRRIREILGSALQENFEFELVRRTATRVGCSEAFVRAITEEWLEQRPLPHLLQYRYPKLRALFEDLRKHGMIVGIFSDYPADRKLDALELDADIVVCAGDRDVGVLKPHPRGLHVLMARAAVQPAQTVLIGDRPERDGLAARAANVRVLIRSSKPVSGWQSFARYDDPIFSEIGVLP